MTQLFLY